jgi:sigma-B regulation protein RsbU (phosphoserine phosphatase)
VLTGPGYFILEAINPKLMNFQVGVIFNPVTPLKKAGLMDTSKKPPGRKSPGGGKHPIEMFMENNLLDTVIDNLPDYIYVKDVDSRFILINKALSDMLGVVAPGAVTGKTDADFFPPEIAEHYTLDDRSTMQSGKPLLDRVETVIDENGNERRLSTSKVPLRDRDDNIIGLVGMSRDVTQRVKAEEQLARYAEQLRLKNEQIESDLNLAHELQQAFLVQKYPVFPPGTSPEKSCISFFHHYQPSAILTGDSFEVLSISDYEAGVFICDVMGHGVRASLLTAVLRGLAQELKSIAHDPGAYLTAINRDLTEILRRAETPMFASAIYMVADAMKGEIRFANAGHPDPLLVRRRQQDVVRIRTKGRKYHPALGLMEQFTYSNEKHSLDDHDLIMLFTDGLYEVEGRDGEMFGQERLRKALRQRIMQSPPEMIDSLLSSIRDFAVEDEFSDDVCLVAVDITRIEPGGS